MASIVCGGASEALWAKPSMSIATTRCDWPRFTLRCCSRWGMYDALLTTDYPLMLARMIPRADLYVMDHAGHHLQEERRRDYYVTVAGFLNQG